MPVYYDANVIVGHIVTEEASQYERKCQRVDAAHFEVDLSRADVVHVYTGRSLPRIDKPFVANIGSTRGRFSFRRAGNPAFVVTPFNVPEAVEDRYFGTAVILSREDGEGPPAQASGRSFAALRGSAAPPTQDDKKYRIGSFARPSVQAMIEQTMHRIDRFRDDVEWLLFSHVPEPEELAGLGAWVDPTVKEDDYDGFVAEA
ncbi:MAG TPA: hypothetical protein VF381_14840, partial [Thermoanaerobaculia bacterium]